MNVPDLRKLLDAAAAGVPEPERSRLSDVRHEGQRRRLAHRAVIAAVVVTLATATTGAWLGLSNGASPGRTNVRTNSAPTTLPKVPTRTPSITYPVAIPPGYSGPRLLFGQPTGGGVWFWVASRRDSRLFFSDTKGGLTSYLIGTSEQDKGGSGTDGLAVGPDGTAWLGIGMTLNEVDPSSATKVRKIALPAVPDNTAAEAYRPPDIRGSQGIEGVAVDTSGTHVAIAIRASTTALVFDSATGTFQQVDLPTGTEANGVAYDKHGGLALSLNDYRDNQTDTILLVGTSGSRVVPVLDSSRIAPLSTGGFVAGMARPTLVTDDGTTRPVPVVPGQASAHLSILNGGLAQLPDGRLAASAGNAVAIIDRTTGRGQLIGLGRYRCFVSPPPALPDGTTTSETTTAVSTPQTCEAIADTLVSDSLGNVWLVSSGHYAALGLLKAGSF